MGWINENKRRVNVKLIIIIIISREINLIIRNESYNKFIKRFHTDPKIFS